MSVLRLSGPSALHVARRVFSRHGKHRGQPWQAKSHRIYYGHVVDEAGTVVDEVTLHVCRAQLSLMQSLGNRAFNGEMWDLQMLNYTAGRHHVCNVGASSI